MAMATDAKISTNLVITIGVALLIAWQTYFIQKIDQNQQIMMQEMATFKGNRFTSSDALKVWQAINEIQARFETLPPEEWRRKIDEIWYWKQNYGRNNENGS